MYRRYRTPSVWHEMDRIQREMNKLFSAYQPTGTRSTDSFPPLNLWADEEQVLLKAEVPGIQTEDLNISIEENTLTLSGERVREEFPENSSIHRQERGYGKFTRAINLPFRVDQDKVEAAMSNGILTISLPRAEEDKPKKITIKA